MTSQDPTESIPPCLSIGIFAWNEEKGLRTTLESLLEQSLFREVHRRGGWCEVFCVANGCTDQTASVAEAAFGEIAANHPHSGALRLRVANIAERGKINAWNRYVHELSAPAASVLFMMDADILIHRRETMENMLSTLEGDSGAHVAVDLPRKHIAHKKRRTVLDRLSLSASETTLAAQGQLCGQLYCIRAEVARKIYLPTDLAACEDGLIKIFVCTDFLAHTEWPARIRVAPGAEHTFEAYTTALSILKNQKRQIMGQTMLHVLVDRFLLSRSPSERADLAGFLRQKDALDPGWLKRLVAEHLKSTKSFWGLYPGLLSIRFRRLRNLSLASKVRCLPATLLASGATLAASGMAYRSLKAGCTDYWPKPQRGTLPAAYPTNTLSPNPTRQ